MQSPLDTFGKYQGIANAMATNDAIKAHTQATKQATQQGAGDYLAKKMASFLSMPIDMQTQGTARQFVDHSLQEGSITPEQASVMHDKINKTTNVRDLQLLTIRGMLGGLGGQEAVNNVFGTSVTHDDGNTQIPGIGAPPIRQSMFGEPGFRPTGGDIQKKLTPGEQNAPTPLPAMGPDNKPTGGNIVVPGSEVARMGGNTHLLPVIPGNGRITAPPGLANPNRAPDPAAAPPASPVLGATLTPAQTAAQTSTGAGASSAFQDISNQAVGARAQDAILANMQADAAQFTPGAGADKIKTFQNAVIRVMGPTGAKAFGLEPDRLAANESFDKLANQIANAQGAGSDARLAVNQAANPNSHTSPAGVDMILRQLRGNTDYLKARATLAAAHPDQADARGFEATVGANLDPRVFQYSRLTPEQKGPYLKSLTDKSSFIKAYKWAEDNRLVAAP